SQSDPPLRYDCFFLPSGASLTVEPGGQLELSSAPAATLDELVEVTGCDLAALRDAAAAAGLELCGYGLDPLRPPRRLLDLPRYAAMEKFFDREGPWGRELMCVREPGSQDWAAPAGVTFRDWLRDGGSGTLRAPTAEDLDYHLSTLFPPVRPRGHMELRMIDAQPGDGWIVPAAVVTALADDDRAADTALAAAEPVWDGRPDAEDPWLRAARPGPGDPELSQASK